MLIRLLYERRKRGWTQRELARRAGCHETTICWIESGRYRADTRTLVGLARALGIADEDGARLLDVVELAPLARRRGDAA
jgi:transcriptional regulator with XRE-family HTH domain